MVSNIIMRSCEEAGKKSSTAVRITEMRTIYRENQSRPALDTNVKPATCAFKSAAKEVAANLSATMLHRMRYEEDERQTTTAPSARKESMASLQSAGFEMGCILLCSRIFHVESPLTYCRVNYNKTQGSIQYHVRTYASGVNVSMQMMTTAQGTISHSSGPSTGRLNKPHDRGHGKLFPLGCIEARRICMVQRMPRPVLALTVPNSTHDCKVPYSHTRSQDRDPNRH